MGKLELKLDIQSYNRKNKFYFAVIEGKIWRVLKKVTDVLSIIRNLTNCLFVTLCPKQSLLVSYKKSHLIEPVWRMQIDHMFKELCVYYELFCLNMLIIPLSIIWLLKNLFNLFHKVLITFCSWWGNDGRCKNSDSTIQ